MKRIAIVFLALILFVSSLFSCSGGDDKNANDGNTDIENVDNNDTLKEDSEVEAKYSDGMIIEAYLPVLALYFYDAYGADDNVLEKDLFHLTAQFIYTQRSDLISKISEDGGTFSVRGSDIENVVRALFGNSINLEDISGYMNAELGDSFDAERGIYYFSTDIINYSPDGYSFSYDEDMDIKEDEKTVCATVTVLDSGENSSKITYTFEKTVFSDYMFTKLIKAEK